MNKQTRIVLTGGPGTGKTSLLSVLASLGHPVLEEYSREVIRESLSKQSDVLPWANLPAFSQRVIEGRVAQWHLVTDTHRRHFFDRSIIDSLAYLIKDQLPIPPQWDELAQIHRYAPTVFITPPWPEIFEQDAERKESLATMVAIHEALIEAYTRYQYAVVAVPRLPLPERAAWLLQATEDMEF